MTQLENADSEMFSFFERTPDLVCIAGKDGFFRRINHAVIEKLEYTKEELFASPISTFIHPEDKEMTAQRRAKLLKGKALINFQNRYVSKSGKIIWLHWTSVYFPDKEVVFAIAKDVTERKLAEKEIEEKYKKFKSLATHFKASLEKDRKYLAVELHEELAQLASVVKMDLDWISNNTPELPPASKCRIEHAQTVCKLLINAMRRISFSISPNMLEDLGLNETLNWLCKEFSLLNGIPCRFESQFDEGQLPYEMKLDFFRICQEALSNVMNHAQARTVKVSIEPAGDKICLFIIDDGRGFELEQQKPTSGLSCMRERAASINGQLIIKTGIGKGTSICLEIMKQSGD